MASASNLRILYVGDIIIEHTYASRALLYRFLESHPPENLLIYEGALGTVDSPYRLPGVVHRTIHTPFDRLCRTRFHRAARTARFYYCELIARALAGAIDKFKPDVVLSVTFEQLWWTAARISEMYGPRLVLSLQDDWLTTTPMVTQLRSMFRRQFDRVLRTAHARLAISPYMRDMYQKEYGVDSDLIFPFRPRDSQVFNEPKPPEPSKQMLVVGYAGSLVLAGYPRCLVKVAAALDRIGGRLLIYSDDLDAARRWPGLKRSNVQFRGFVPNEELVQRMRDEVDVLVSPASFMEEERENMEMLFPSKMTQYTATGLPIVVIGPAYASLTRWARDYPGVAEVVETQDEEAIATAFIRLIDSDYRGRLAAEAIKVGRQLFSYDDGINCFYEALGACVSA